MTEVVGSELMHIDKACESEISEGRYLERRIETLQFVTAHEIYNFLHGAIGLIVRFLLCRSGGLFSPPPTSKGCLRSTSTLITTIGHGLLYADAAHAIQTYAPVSSNDKDVRLQCSHSLCIGRGQFWGLSLWQLRVPRLCNEHLSKAGIAP
jgi:hypothetical protein